MAIAFVQHAAAQAPSISADAVTSGVDTSGATLLVVGTTTNDALQAPTDSKGNTWVNITSLSAAVFSGVYYVKNPTVGAGHTFTCAGTNRVAAVAMLCFSGTDTSLNVDQSNSHASASASSIAPGSITPGVDNEVVCTFYMGNAVTITSPPTDANNTYIGKDTLTFLAGQAYAMASAYVIQTSALAANPSWATALSVDHAHVASFKAGAGGGFTPLFRKTLSGIGSHVGGRETHGW